MHHRLLLLHEHSQAEALLPALLVARRQLGLQVPGRSPTQLEFLSAACLRPSRVCRYFGSWHRGDGEGAHIQVAAQAVTVVRRAVGGRHDVKVGLKAVQEGAHTVPCDQRPTSLAMLSTLCEQFASCTTGMAVYIQLLVLQREGGQTELSARLLLRRRTCAGLAPPSALTALSSGPAHPESSPPPSAGMLHPTTHQQVDNSSVVMQAANLRLLSHAATSEPLQLPGMPVCWNLPMYADLRTQS